MASFTPQLVELDDVIALINSGVLSESQPYLGIDADGNATGLSIPDSNALTADDIADILNYIPVSPALLISQLANKQIAGDYATNTALITGLSGKQVSGDYATNTALTTGLAGKQPSGSYALTSDLSAYATSTALTTGLAGKQAVGSYLDTSTTRSANLLYAGPGSGSAAAPTFRVLVPLDIPSSLAGTGLTSTSGVLSVTSPAPTGTTNQTLRYNSSGALVTGGNLTNDGTNVYIASPGYLDSVSYVIGGGVAMKGVFPVLQVNPNTVWSSVAVGSTLTAKTFKSTTTSATDIHLQLNLANSQSANAIEVNSFGGSGGNLVKVLSTGKTVINPSASTIDTTASADLFTGSGGVYSYNGTTRYIRFNTNGTANDFKSTGTQLVINFGAAAGEDIMVFPNSGVNGHFRIGGQFYDAFTSYFKVTNPISTQPIATFVGSSGGTAVVADSGKVTSSVGFGAPMTTPSVTTTTPTTVDRWMQAYDENGTAIGRIAIYNITP